VIVDAWIFLRQWGVLEVSKLAAKAVKPAPVRRRQVREKQSELLAAAQVPPALMTMSDAARYTSMSLTMMKKLIWQDSIKSLVIGARFRRVPRKELDAWIDRVTGGAA
jgi:excisionase family DNA binding protein